MMLLSTVPGAIDDPASASTPPPSSGLSKSWTRGQAGLPRQDSALQMRLLAAVATKPLRILYRCLQSGKAQHGVEWLPSQEA